MSPNQLFDDDELGRRGYVDRRSDPNRLDRDHEVSLGTPAILGIFFALALVCAGFFGFGYTLGRKSVQSVTTPVIANSIGDTGAAKPAAGSLAAQPTVTVAQPADETPAPTPAVQTETVPLTPPAAAKNGLTPADSVIAGEKVPKAEPVTTAQPATAFVVQIAAVSSQDVADILISSLQKKGYTVAVRHEAQDKLLHVQIGPFANRADADAMRTRVLADGFNAIVK